MRTLQASSVSDITKILTIAVNQAHLAKSMQTASSFSPVFTFKLVPFMSAASTLLSLDIEPSQESTSRKRWLDSVITGWGLELLVFNGTGW